MKNKFLILSFIFISIIYIFLNNENIFASSSSIDDLKQYFTDNKEFTFKDKDGNVKKITLSDLPSNLFKSSYSNYHDFLGFYDGNTNKIYFLFNNVDDNSNLDMLANSNRDFFFFRPNFIVAYFKDYVSYDVASGSWDSYNNSLGSYMWSIKGDSYFCSNTNVYITNNGLDLELFSSPNEKDDTISNPDSDLQLSFNYNEDYTECKISAILKKGSFTDSIYYSNIPPSIAGQGLLTKKIFPRERNNNKRKSIFIFPS